MDIDEIEPLSEERARAGKEILRLTDELDMGVQAAGWIWVSEAKAWRLYLVTSLLAERGPRWIYERLLKVFTKIALPQGITPLDIHIGNPRDPMFRSIPILVDFDIELDSSGIFAWIEPPGTEGAAKFYRLCRNWANTGATSHAFSSRRFDRRVRDLLAA